MTDKTQLPPDVNINAMLQTIEQFDISDEDECTQAEYYLKQQLANARREERELTVAEIKGYVYGTYMDEKERPENRKWNEALDCLNTCLDRQFSLLKGNK